MNKEELKEILDLHRKWLFNIDGGKRANLSSADLRSAKTDKRYIQVSCIGSRKDMTTYCFEDDLIICGCFKGTLKEFKEKVLETYPDKKSQYHKEYLGFIKYLEGLK